MMSRFFLSLIAFLAAWSLPVARAAAYDCPFTWEPVTDADWAIAQDTAKGINDAAMIFERVSIDDSELRRITVKQLTSCRCYRTFYRRVRVLNAAGREWADVDVPLLHDDQKIESIQGRTIQRDGTITTLQPGQIHEKEVVKTDDEKVKQTSFSLPGATDDCILEYIISLKMPYSGIQWLVQKDIPLLAFTFDWNLANAQLDQEWYDYYRSSPIRDFTIPNYLWLNPHSLQRIDMLPDKEKPEILRFTTEDVPAFREEPSAMTGSSLKESLVCYNGTDAGSSTYWGTWSKGLAENLVIFCQKNKRVKEVVTGFASLADTTTKIQAAYDWIQSNILNLTYLDLRDKNDSTKILDPEPRYSVDDIIKLGYGSRSEIDRLFWSMLREMGVPAKLTYVGDRDELFVESAKYWQFHRSLVAVPLGHTKFRFYAPGHACTPPGLIPWYLEGVTGLMLDADEYLMMVPFSDAPATKITSRALVSFTDDLAVKCRMRTERTGQEARTMRMAIFDEASSTHFDNLKDEIDDVYSGAEFETITYENFDSINQPFVLNLDMKYPSVSPVGDRILLKPCDYVTGAKNALVKTERFGPVLFRCAYTITETTDFSMPAGWSVDALPGDTAYRNKVGQCEIRFTGTTDGFSMARTFTLLGPYWLQADYAAVRRLLQAREDMSERIVVLKSEGDAGASK